RWTSGRAPETWSASAGDGSAEGPRRQGAGGDARLLGYQDPRDHARRDRRRHRQHDDGPWLSRRHRDLPDSAGRLGVRPDRCEEIPPVPLLGHHRRLDDGGHHHGGLCDPLAGHRICRRVCAAPRRGPRLARRLAFRDRLCLGRSHRKRPERDLLLDPITLSQTLGTALGDWTADDGGFGYGGAALIFGAMLAVLAALYFATKVSRVFLFWAAFILTRPLGATV